MILYHVAENATRIQIGRIIFYNDRTAKDIIFFSVSSLRAVVKTHTDLLPSIRSHI